MDWMPEKTLRHLHYLEHSLEDSRNETNEFLLYWCSSILGEEPNNCLSIKEYLCTENRLARLISKFCPVKFSQDSIEHLSNSLLAAENFLDISGKLVNPVNITNGTVDDFHITNYLKILQEKIFSAQLTATGLQTSDRFHSNNISKAKSRNGQKEQMKKTKPSKNSFKPKPTVSEGTPIHGKTSRILCANGETQSNLKLGNPRRVENDAGFKQSDIHENVSNYVNESEEDATIPKINLDDVNNDFITEQDDYEEIIYGGHGSSGKPPLGPRVTEVIQQDGQMTIEMEVDIDDLCGAQVDLEQLASQGGMDQLLQMAMGQEGLVIDDGERLIVFHVEEETDSCESDRGDMEPERPAEKVTNEEPPFSAYSDQLTEATSTSHVPHPPSTPRTQASSRSPRHRPLRPAQSRSSQNTDLPSEYSISSSMEFDMNTHSETEQQPKLKQHEKSYARKEMDYEEDQDEDVIGLSQLSDESIEIVMTKGALMLKELQQLYNSQFFSDGEPNIPHSSHVLLEQTNEPANAIPSNMASTPRGNNKFEVLVLPDSSEEDEDSNTTIDGTAENGEEGETWGYSLDLSGTSIREEMELEVMETSNDVEKKVTVDTGKQLLEITEDEAKQYEGEISIDFSPEMDNYGGSRLQNNKNQSLVMQKNQEKSSENKLGRNIPNNNNPKEESKDLDVNITNVFVPIAENGVVEVHKKEEMDSSDWMAASINSLIESANEAVLRGISKEHILASIQDVQDEEDGNTKDSEQVTSEIRNTIIENLSRYASRDFACQPVDEEAFQPLLSEVSESFDINSNRLTPVSARSNDELLQLLDTIDKQGKEMRTELDIVYAQEKHDELVLDVTTSKTIEKLNEEVEALRDENLRMHKEVKRCREATAKDKSTITSLENSIVKVQDVVKLAQEERRPYKNQSIKTKEERTQTNLVKTGNKEIQTDYVHRKSCATATEKVGKDEKGTDCFDLACSLRTDACTQVFIPFLEGDVTHLKTNHQNLNATLGMRSGKRATQMIDDILYQMSTIASDNIDTNMNAVQAKKEASLDPECPDKWRTLSMTPLSSDPMILQLQKSLACATLENDLLETKVSKASKEADKKACEMSVKLEAAQDELNRLVREKERLVLRFKGDSHEMELLKDRITGLERTLFAAQAENSRLTSRLQTAISEERNNLEKEYAEIIQKLENENKQMKERVLTLENDKLTLQRDLLKLQNSQVKSDATVVELKNSLTAVYNEKKQLQTEVSFLKKEYSHLKQNMEEMEKIFKTDAIPTTAKMDLNAKVSERNNVHSSIMLRSEKVLEEIKEAHSIQRAMEPETLVKPVRWEDVESKLVKQNVERVGEQNRSDEAKKQMSTNCSSEIIQFEKDRVYKTLTGISPSEMNETRDAEGLSISEEIQAVESRISRELGIKIQLVGQVAAREALPGDETRGKWAFPREPSPINSSTRAPTPVRTSGGKASSLNTSFYGSSESVNKAKLNYSDGDATLNVSRVKNRPEPLKKPIIDPRKIEDYEELRKKRLALMLQAFTGREDTDTLLEEAKHNTEVPDQTKTAVSASTTVNTNDRETISHRVKEIIARYSDSGAKTTEVKNTETKITEENNKPNDRKAQATKVPYYQQPRRQIYPHKKNYRPPGSETETEADEVYQNVDGGMNKTLHDYDAPKHGAEGTNDRVAHTIHSPRNRNKIQQNMSHEIQSSHNFHSSKRSSSPRRPPNFTSHYGSTSHEESLTAHRMSSNRQSLRGKAHRPSSPKQTNLNYSSSRGMSHKARSQFTNNFDSDDAHLNQSPHLYACKTPHALSANGEGVKYHDSSFDKTPKALESEPDSDRIFKNTRRSKAVLNSYSSEIPTVKVRDEKNIYNSNLRDAIDNIRRSPCNPMLDSDTAVLDTDALVAKYTSPQSPVSSPRNLRKSDLRFTSEPEFLVTGTGSIRQIDQNIHSNAPWSSKRQNSTENLNGSEEHLIREVSDVTSKLGVHWREPKLYDNRYGMPTSQPSTSLIPPPQVSPNPERSTSQQNGSTRSSPKSPSFPWHSNRGSHEDLTYQNVTDEEKRRQASNSTSSPSRHRSSTYRQTSSPRFSSLTMSHGSRPSSRSDSSSLTSSSLSSRYGNRGLRTSTNGVSSLKTGLTTPRSSTYQRPSESLTRHTISSSLKSGASKVHEVCGNPTRPVLQGGSDVNVNYKSRDRSSRNPALSEGERECANELIDSYMFYHERNKTLQGQEKDQSFEKVIEKYTQTTDTHKPSDDVAKIIQKYATRV